MKVSRFATILFRKPAVIYGILLLHLEMLPIVEEIKKGNHNPLNSKALMDLMSSCLVLECNGEQWCDLHPLLEDHLTDTKRPAL